MLVQIGKIPEVWCADLGCPPYLQERLSSGVLGVCMSYGSFGGKMAEICRSCKDMHAKVHKPLSRIIWHLGVDGKGILEKRTMLAQHPVVEVEHGTMRLFGNSYSYSDVSAYVFKWVDEFRYNTQRWHKRTMKLCNSEDVLLVINGWGKVVSFDD